MLDVKFLKGQEHHLLEMEVFFYMTLAYLIMLNHRFNILFNVLAL